MNGNGAPTDINRFESLYATIQGHPSAAGAAAVGAIFWAQTSTCGVRFPKVELYSSTGGDPIMFDTAGARLSRFVLRQKPDFVAPDGANDTFLGFTLASADVKVSSTVFGCQNLGEVPNFFGTSAAAPHAAGAAALLGRPTPRAPLRNSSALCRRLPSRSASRATRMTSAGMGSFRWMRHWQV